MDLNILRHINRLEDEFCLPCKKLVGINESADVKRICSDCEVGQELQNLGKRLNGEPEKAPDPPKVEKAEKVVEEIKPIEVRKAEALILLSGGLDFEEVGRKTGLSKVAVMTIHSNAKRRERDG